ncbi:MAG: hypothetical protein NUV91_09290 [Candidatus Omnitrophica bacterium]|nr:hypothetical protein [Candidatus Omnitrophota bacterium]
MLEKPTNRSKTECARIILEEIILYVQGRGEKTHISSVSSKPLNPEDFENLLSEEAEQARRELT